MCVCVCVSVSEGLPLCILDEVALLSFAADEARLLLDVSCFCADIILYFVHSHYISYGTVKSMNYAL